MALSYKNDPEEDERLNPATRAKDIQSQEQAPYDREFSDIENNFNDTADASQEDENIQKSKNINSALEQENTIPYSHAETPGKGKIDLKGIWKKVGPFGFIGAILFGGGGLGMFFFSPGLLLVQMKEIFTNYGSSASRAAPARYNKMLKYTINNTKVKVACASNPTGKKCTLGTMSETQKANYEKAGFKINGEDVDGRTRITSVKFPDGKQVTSGDDFISHTRRSVAAASAASKAHNPATKVFNGGRFTTNVLKRFGLTRTKEDVSGKDDKERKDDFNKRTGNDISDEERGLRFTSKYKDRIVTSAKPSKTSLITGPVALGCAAYNIAKITTAAVKVENGLRFTAFAFQFLKAADQIKDQGSIKPETASFLGGVLTATAVSGEKAGLSATDSQGYKVAAYGGEGLLKKFTQAFLLGGNPILITVDNTIQWFNNLVGGRRNVRTVCKSAADPRLAALVIAAVCAGEIFGSAGGGTLIIPGVGTVVGGLVGAASCLIQEVLTLVAFILAGNYFIGWMVDHVLPVAINMLANAKLDVNKISSVDAGNAIAVGAGVMLGTTALSRGLKAGNKSDVTKFLASTADDKAQMDQIAMYDSRNEPFNIYNEYSFLGSTVRKMGVALHVPSSSGEVFSNLGAIISAPLRLLSPNAGASPASMPVSISDADLSACPDNDMKDIGIDCDKMGNPQFVLSPAELAMEVSDNLDYMIPRYVNEDGSEVSDTAYVKWLANCTEQREAPMGATFMSVEDDDYYWGTGENCLKASDGVTEEDLSNFRVYYNSLGEKEDGDYTPATGSLLAGAGSRFRAATFNILGSSHTDTFEDRANKSINVINENNLEIIGFQEFQVEQRKYIFERIGSSYDIYPKIASKQPNPIVWSSARFSLIDSGMMPDLEYFGGSVLQAPWVILEDKITHQQFYILNTHDPAHNENKAKRYRNANKHVTFIKSIQSKGLPIIFTGDFNSGYSLRHGTGNDTLDDDPQKLAYCILSKDSLMHDVYDLSEKRTFKCPNPGNDNAIDHIFVSDGVLAEKFKKVGNNGSDHQTHMADILIPSAGGDGSSSSLAWPVDEKWWKTNRADFLDSHPTYSGTFTSPYEKGTAADIGDPPDGSPVYSMLTGKVIKTNLCGQKDGMIIESKVSGGTLQIAYGHGINPRYNVGDTVDAGKQILDLGAVGCQITGGHLHVDMAFNGKHLCPQDVFLAMGENKIPDYNSLTSKVTVGCSGRG